MENTETMVQTAVPYNPNQLVTYKVINDGEATYPTSKVVDIEYDLDRGRYWRNQWNDISGKVARLENDLAEYLDMDAEEIVTAICDIFGFTPTKEIEFEGTVTFSGTISVPLSDVADFDIDLINFDVDINSDSGDVTIYNAEVDNVTTL
jgi:hypothetical protein